MTGPRAGGRGLPVDLRRVPAVVAHPDDESFGLGGLPALLSALGVPITVLCFTPGPGSASPSPSPSLGSARPGGTPIASQSTDHPVLWRRLELLEEGECLRRLL